MVTSSCICKNGQQSAFSPYITYEHETVFSAFEGTVIARCTNCGILKTFPAKNNHHYNPQQSRGVFYEENMQRFRSIFQPIVSLVQKYKPHGYVLDVGCSTGILLALLKEKKYEVFGVEPNLNAYKLARKKLGHNIFNGTLASYARQMNKKFDVIIYNHVLEHIENVTGELILVQKLLKKDGVLVIGVPNVRNFVFTVRQKKWELLMPNEHMWQFSDIYLNQLLSCFGFKTEAVVFDNDYRIEYSLMKQLYFRLLILLNKLFHTGEVLLLVARKK